MLWTTGSVFSMVANPDRRAAVCDAALRILGREGARALTHRAVDREAELPLGTTSNYFSTRSALFAGMATRLFEALEPAPARLEKLKKLNISVALDDFGTGYSSLQYISQLPVDSLKIDRSFIEQMLKSRKTASLVKSVIEMARRSPEISALVMPVLREGFAQDVAFHEERGLPGRADTVRALHYLVDGLIFDALTVQIDPQADPIDNATRISRTFFPQ